MNRRLPFLAEAEESLNETELQTLKLKYERESSSKDPSSQAKFDFGWVLIRSNYKKDQQEGVRLLKQLYEEEPEMRREAGFYLALGYFKLGKYSEARQLNNLLLEIEPKNIQAKALKDMLETKLAQDGTIGMFIVGGLIAAAGVVTALVFKKN